MPKIEIATYFLDNFIVPGLPARFPSEIHTAALDAAEKPSDVADISIVLNELCRTLEEYRSRSKSFRRSKRFLPAELNRFRWFEGTNLALFFFGQLTF